MFYHFRYFLIKLIILMLFFDENYFYLFAIFSKTKTRKFLKSFFLTQFLDSSYEILVFNFRTLCIHIAIIMHLQIKCN